MIGDDIIKALREAIAYKRGELTEADGVNVCISEENKQIIDAMDEVHKGGLKVFTSVEELFKSWEDDNEE